MKISLPVWSSDEPAGHWERVTRYRVSFVHILPSFRCEPES
jgi:hypothetical protein